MSPGFCPVVGEPQLLLRITEAPVWTLDAESGSPAPPGAAAEVRQTAPTFYITGVLHNESV